MFGWNFVATVLIEKPYNGENISLDTLFFKIRYLGLEFSSDLYGGITVSYKSSIPKYQYRHGE